MQGQGSAQGRAPARESVGVTRPMSMGQQMKDLGPFRVGLNAALNIKHTSSGKAGATLNCLGYISISKRGGEYEKTAKPTSITGKFGLVDVMLTILTGRFVMELQLFNRNRCFLVE
jgi:hypothetical protein